MSILGALLIHDKNKKALVLCNLESYVVFQVNMFKFRLSFIFINHEVCENL
jgi:hypothetical protein